MKRILVIDDEPIICEALSRFLGLHDYSVQTAQTMAAAWRLLETGGYDLVILDITLGGESGLDLLPLLKEKFPSLPILILTALDFEEHLLQQAARRGASGYVTKGLLSEHLLDEVKRVLTFPTKRPAHWDRRRSNPDSPDE